VATSNVGIAVFDTDQIDAVVELAMNFFMMDDTAVSESVAGLLYQYFAAHAEFAEIAVRQVMQRMKNYFAAEDFPGGKLLKTLNRLIYAAALGNFDATLAAFSEEAQEVNVEEDAAHAAAVLTVLFDLVQKKLIREGDSEIVGKVFTSCRQIWTWQPPNPIPHPLFLSVAAQFLRMPIAFDLNDRRFPINQFTSEFLKAMGTFATSENVPEHCRVVFLEILLQYLKAWWQKVATNTDLISGFLTSGLYRVAGCLTGNLQNQTAFLGQLLGRFQTMLHRHEVALGDVVQYFATVPLNPQSFDVVLEFLGGVAAADDETFASLIYATKQFDYSGFELVLAKALEGLEMGIKSSIAVVEVSCQLRLLGRANTGKPNYDALQDEHVWTDLAGAFCGHFETAIRELAGPRYDDWVLILYRRLLEFFGVVGGLLPDQLVVGVIGLTKELLMIKYDVAMLWDPLLVFVSQYLAVDEPKTDIVITTFVPFSLNFVMAPEFDPARPEWIMIMRRTLDIQMRIVGAKKMYAEFTAQIAEILAGFGIKEEEVDAFMPILEQDARVATPQMARFYFSLMRAKNGITWG
jgi:hypothetical protein